MHTGETEFEIDGQKLTLVYDWRALSLAQSAHGNDVFKRMFNLGPEVIADILLIGLKKNHPDMTKDKILDASPPVIPAIRAIDQALTYAYFGPDGKPPSTGEDDGKKTE